MPAPTFQPVAPRKAASYPQTQAVHQPSTATAAATAPDAAAPGAAAANLTIDAPGRIAGPTQIPAGQPGQPGWPGERRPARPWFRRPGLVAALAVTLAGLVAITVIAVPVHHPGAPRTSLGGALPSPTATHPSATPAHPSPTATTTSPAPTAVTSLSILPSAIRCSRTDTIALNLQGQLANGSSGASQQALTGPTWTSANPAIADVSGAGGSVIVTATGTGSTYITARSQRALASARLVVANNPATPTASRALPATYTYWVFHTCRGPQQACGLDVRSGPGNQLRGHPALAQQRRASARPPENWSPTPRASRPRCGTRRSKAVTSAICTSTPLAPGFQRPSPASPTPSPAAPPD